MSRSSSVTESAHRMHFNSIWFVPLIAAIVAGWMLVENWSRQGPEVTVVAESADGLVAGKTKVKAHNVDVGEVTDIHLSDDFNHAIIRIRMEQGSEAMLNSKSKFWVVKPRVGKEGISGLGTILSGAFINIHPGRGGEKREHFTMLKQPPLSTADNQGIRLKLYSTDNAKMEVGSPVHFRGFEVGYIENVGFDVKRKAITYHIFVNAPYDALVRSNVQFWMTPGLVVEGTAKGVEVRMDSLQTLFSGGISFGMTNARDAGSSVKDLTEFRLFSSKEAAANNRYDKYIDYIMLVRGSISGLLPGAPLEYNGIRLGTVKEVPFRGGVIESSEDIRMPSIPILVRLEPQRIASHLSEKIIKLDEWRKMLAQGFDQGMRATLSSSNLLTGAKVVSVVFVKDPKPMTETMYLGYPVFPTVSSSLASMQEKITLILDHLAALPMEQTVGRLNQTLAAADDTFNELHEASKSLKKLLSQQNTQEIPDRLVSVLETLNETLSDYQAQGALGQNIQQSLDAVQRNLETLYPLLQDLHRQPNSIIFGKQSEADIEPKVTKGSAK
ncbi:intermembrane transport protein PqiB [Vibrio gazogenes]|uniref:Paraquat-inducible protein B n=1 Tax=Vibrio gazogenes DSM 21264 = NBRC 103151 TaxID=1123492 RepID=A0A1M5EL05_VIBGA|nr:intermembrane transport protein PqiB [Vibrio gazogenes]USP12554.1 intermembrane transport protein PqiB [Vibrio gazogenes]SHF79895.1 paraquat-inducible protein B [Vibrio gazogenes DSM 21264] [Vibrio gazogenes DSM 21264 = NBRC 103151]SJN54041.1 Paraquat-inducible protein B [Vibrio gazogenes]